MVYAHYSQRRRREEELYLRVPSSLDSGTLDSARLLLSNLPHMNHEVPVENG